MQAWADGKLAEVRARYAGVRDIWYVPMFPQGYWWCSRPVGAATSDIVCDDPDELVKLIEASQ